jgi:hypothetical protein
MNLDCPNSLIKSPHYILNEITVLLNTIVNTVAQKWQNYGVVRTDCHRGPRLAESGLNSTYLVKEATS